MASDLGGINEDRAAAVAAQADGKIVLGGSVQRDGAGDFDFAAARLNPDGSLDATFDADGRQVVPFDLGGATGQNADLVAGVAIQRDRKIVFAGSAQRNATGFDFAIARLLGDNRAPTAVADTATSTGTPVVVAVLANDIDPDGDPLAVTIASGPAQGVAVANADGTVTYTPNAGFVGADTFVYAVSDRQGGVATATVAITVTPPSPPQGAAGRLLRGAARRRAAAAHLPAAAPLRAARLEGVARRAALAGTPCPASSPSDSTAAATARLDS